MTFQKAPLAIDGPLTTSSILRLGMFSSVGGAEGIIKKADLKVSTLDVPGNGIKIGGGGSVILNRYQSSPDQVYIVNNIGFHTLGSADMPAANPAAQHYLVCLVVGDPEFSQVGHPFMPSQFPAGQEDTFQYVRPVVVPCPNGTSDFSALALNYPAYAVARLEIPANTTTITAAMIKDLRYLARPRSQEEIEHVAGVATTLNGAGGVAGTYQKFPNVNVLSVKVPEWAVKANITGFVEGIRLEKAGSNKLRVAVDGTALATSLTNVNELAPSTASQRRSYSVGGALDVTSIAGQTVNFVVQGTPTATADKGSLVSDTSTSVQLRVLFREVAS